MLFFSQLDAESDWRTANSESIKTAAADAGIPVVLIDRTIKTEDESLFVTFMVSDFREEGRKAGRCLIDKMKYKKGDINIIELQGTIGSSPAIQRKEGFEEVIKTSPNMKIIKSVSADFMRSKVMKQWKNC